MSGQGSQFVPPCHYFWICMLDLSDQIEGRLQPQRIACKNDVNRDKHHSHQHDLAPSPLRCGWQRNDREYLWIIDFIALDHIPDAIVQVQLAVTAPLPLPRICVDPCAGKPPPATA